MKTLEIIEEGKITTIVGRAKSGKSTVLTALINKKGNNNKTHIYFAGEENKQYLGGKFIVKDIRIFEVKTLCEIKMYLEQVVLDLVETPPIGIIAIDAIDCLSGKYKEFMEWLEDLLEGNNKNWNSQVDWVYITKQM